MNHFPVLAGLHQRIYEAMASTVDPVTGGLEPSEDAMRTAVDQVAPTGGPTPMPCAHSTKQPWSPQSSASSGAPASTTTWKS